MPNRHFKSILLFVVALLAFGWSPVNSQEPSAVGVVPVHMVVTAEARHGAQEPELSREDVMVYLGRTRAQVTDWIPLRGEHAALELFLLLDDAFDVSLGSQLEDLRQFILLQPPTTLIGVGYMRDGTVDTVQNFTDDHTQAAKALRLPMGNVGAFASPYLSISDLIKRWPESSVRHEILMITDGIDRFGDVGPSNPYVDTAIEQAQKRASLSTLSSRRALVTLAECSGQFIGAKTIFPKSQRKRGASLFSRIRDSRLLCTVSRRLEQASESSISAGISRQTGEKTWLAKSASEDRGQECP